VAAQHLGGVVSTEFWTMIVPSDRAVLARAIAAALSPAGVGMFIVGVCPAAGPATDAATGYISTGMIDAQFAPLLKNGPALYAAAIAAGVDCTLAECQALVDESDVTQERPLPSDDGEGALARLNLQRQLIADDLA
jgi:hypothetical protein